MNYKFSELFNVSKKNMNDYGVYDISLFNDTPAFIDPFLLFVSDKKEYREAHEKLVNYIMFLCDVIKAGGDEKAIKRKYFYFKEPKQNWLGFSEFSNSGRGLNKDFADKFFINLRDHLALLEKGELKHIEELIIFDEGFGKDSISDFTTRLILDFLLEYTEKFAKSNIDSSLCQEFMVPKAYFDHDLKIWRDKQYWLPCYQGDYVILTPKDILIEGDDFICRTDFLRFLKYSMVRIPDARLREHVNEYLSKIVDDRLTVEQKRDLTNELINTRPELIKIYVGEKETSSQDAINDNNAFVSKVETVLDENLNAAISFLEKETNFYSIKNSNKNDVLKRLNIMRESLLKFTDTLFYVEGRFIGNQYASVIINRIWRKSKNDAFDVDFRFTFNSPIENVLKLFDYRKKVLCYISLSEKEINRFNKVSNKLNISSKDVIHFALLR